MRKSFIGRIIAMITFTLTTVMTYANDGEFHISGNHLVPISNTDIKIVKEVLTIRLSDTTDYTYVDVDYTFLNTSSEPKTIKMGFEAKIEDDWAYLPAETHKGHPSIWNFNVEMNGKHVNHTNEYAFYEDSVHLDYKNFPVDKTKWVLGGKEYRDMDDGTWWDQGLMNRATKEFKPYAHVYLFSATFLPGENKIHHTYIYDCGRAITEDFMVRYWLTPAMRWNASKIEDFTLRIVAEGSKHFRISGPFDKGSFNIANGMGKHRKSQYGGKEVVLRNATIEYHCKDFIPDADLWINSFDGNLYNDKHKKGITAQTGAYYRYGNFFGRLQNGFEGFNDFEKRVIRNLPYASRGYVFKDKKLADYFSQFYWYMPDPEWQASTKDFSPREREFITGEYFNINQVPKVKNLRNFRSKRK